MTDGDNREAARPAVSIERAVTELSYALEYNPVSGRDFGSIKHVLAAWYADRYGWDDRNGVWLVEFNDGTRAAFIGGHDSTGWDCQSTLNLLPFDDWERVITDDYGLYGAYTYAAPLAEVIDSIKEQLGRWE